AGRVGASVRPPGSSSPGGCVPAGAPADPAGRGAPRRLADRRRPTRPLSGGGRSRRADRGGGGRPPGTGPARGLRVTTAPYRHRRTMGPRPAGAGGDQPRLQRHQVWRGESGRRHGGDRPGRGPAHRDRPWAGNRSRGRGADLRAVRPRRALATLRRPRARSVRDPEHRRGSRGNGAGPELTGARLSVHPRSAAGGPRMKALLLWVLLGAASHTVNPFDGTWVTRPESVATKKPWVIGLEKGVWTSDLSTPPVKVRADGKDQQAPGHLGFTTVAVKVTGPTSVEVTSKNGGRVVFVRSLSVGADGKSMVEKWTDRTGPPAGTGET